MLLLHLYGFLYLYLHPLAANNCRKRFAHNISYRLLWSTGFELVIISKLSLAVKPDEAYFVKAVRPGVFNYLVSFVNCAVILGS